MFGGLFTENFTRKVIGNGVNFTVINEEKFKKNQTLVNFLLPLKKETAALNALLPLVLRHGCSKYPSMTALNKRLKWLYGAMIDGGVSKIGEIQVVTIVCENLNEKYAISNDELQKECSELLNAVIFDPALENGVFKKDDVELEKNNLKDQVESLMNDKRQYATIRLKEEMCKDEPFGICEFGDKESIDKITPEELTKQWKEIITSAKCEIIVIGAKNSEKTEELFKASFEKLNRNNLIDVKTIYKTNVSEPKTVIEKMPVSQAKLVMGFRIAELSGEKTSAMRLACAILGGTTQSKLFVNVREKMSLCYYCSSSLERHKSLMFINSGIEEKNFEKAKKEILNQLEDLKAGKFDDNEFDSAKLSLKNSFYTVADSGYSLAIYYLGHSLHGEIITPKQAAEDIMEVTREEVVELAKSIKLDTIYLLCSNENNESKEGEKADD